VTEWRSFRDLDLRRVRDNMATPIVVDLRNHLSPERAAEAGLFYQGIGFACLPLVQEERRRSLISA
jgi:UDPglucose 6-dehydrogenase